MTLRTSVFAITSILFLNSQLLLPQQKLADLTVMKRDTILIDPFDNNDNKWISDNEYISGKFENSRFLIKCKNFKGSGGLTYVSVPLDNSKDYEIVTDIEVIKGSGGVVFGMNEKLDHYRIELSDKGNLMVLKNTLSPNKIEPLFTLTKSTLFGKGLPVKIKITRYGGKYFLYLQDNLLKEISGIRSPGDRIGFNVAINSEISIDNLMIAYLGKDVEKLASERTITKPDTSIKTFSNSDSGLGMAINWTSPVAERTNLTEYSGRVKARISSKVGIETIQFYVNGVNVGESEFQSVTAEPGVYQVERNLSFKPGENSVYFMVSDKNRKSERSATRYFINPVTVPPEIKWSYPSESRTIVNVESFSIDSYLKSPAGLNAVRILVNGTPFEENPYQLNQQPGGIFRLQRQVILKDGENSIYISATNAAGTAYSEGRIIFLNKAISEKRIALVIGNSKYSNGTDLKNPVNDADLMEATLRSLDFKVIKGENLGMNAMLDSIREFSRRLSDYNVALFYFAGHGVQVDGTNYLIPVDAKLNDKNDCNWEAIAVNKVTDEFRKHSTSTNIVILDACRNNPFRSWARGPESGFKAMGPINGTIISFATSEGFTATDGSGANGTFTEELVRQMIVPQQIESVFKNTRKKVKERTKDLQIPMEWNYLTEEFYFVKPGIK